jgi:hypothetical protein
LNWRIAIIVVALVGMLGIGAIWGWRGWQQSPPPVNASAKDSTRQPLQRFPPFFEDMTDVSGIDFRHWSGDGGKHFFPEVMGSGLALVDYDRDGRLDLFVVQAMPTASAQGKSRQADRPRSATSRLYRQEASGKFRDVTTEAGLTDDLPYGIGTAVGDINNDGWPDLYVTKYGADRLILNREGTFQDITDESGIVNPRWGTSAAFLDFDRDGWLDLFVANYVDYFPSKHCIAANGIEDYCSPQSFSDAPARLFRNLSGEASPVGSAVRFQDVSLESGIDAKPGPGLGVVVQDFNADGWPDIYVANDQKANFLWFNQRNGSFAEEAIPSGAAYDRAGKPQSSMGVTCGDVDGDGLGELFMTHLDGEYSTLYRQLTAGVFEDNTIASGLGGTTPFTGFGTALADLDLDGDLDLLIANGRVRRGDAVREKPHDPAAFWRAYCERNQLYVNPGEGKFVEAEPAGEPFCTGEHVSRGLAVGDWDNDGDLDVVTSEVNGPTRLYRNVAPRQGNWLLVRAIEPTLGGRDAYGALVTVQIAGQTQMRTVSPAYSYLSSNDPRVHFGLGSAKHFDQVRVRWPGGDEELFPGGDVNRQLLLEHGQGTPP